MSLCCCRSTREPALIRAGMPTTRTPSESTPRARRTTAATVRCNRLGKSLVSGATTDVDPLRLCYSSHPHVHVSLNPPYWLYRSLVFRLCYMHLMTVCVQSAMFADDLVCLVTDGATRLVNKSLLEKKSISAVYSFPSLSHAHLRTTTCGQAACSWASTSSHSLLHPLSLLLVAHGANRSHTANELNETPAQTSTSHSNRLYRRRLCSPRLPRSIP